MSKNRDTRASQKAQAPKVKRRTRHQEYVAAKRRIEELKLKTLTRDDRLEIDGLRLRMMELKPRRHTEFRPEGQMSAGTQSPPSATGARIVGGGAPGLGKRR